RLLSSSDYSVGTLSAGAPALQLHIGESTQSDSMIFVITKKCFNQGDLTLSKLRVVGEFWQFLKYDKKFWLAPIVLVLVVVGFLLYLAASSALAPFIYSLF